VGRDSLSALDVSFLEVESPTAHMHVGWAAQLAPPRGRARPRFSKVRDLIAGRLERSPRYRQKLAEVPMGLGNPVWVDDEDFDLDRHVRHSRGRDLGRIADRVMSEPLDPTRPLWEFWIADQLPDGRLGIVGKAHHCMVDGLAAVELASLLLDPDPDSESASEDRGAHAWQAQPPPDGAELLAAGIRGRVGAGLGLALTPARLVRSPRRLLRLPGQAGRAARALADAFRPAPGSPALNRPISGKRHLARARRPLDDLLRVKRAYGATVNDVLLAAAAGGLRRFLKARGEDPLPLKTMVPVSVRESDGDDELGNQISFIFVDLPCDEPDPVRRLRTVQASVGERKAAGEPEAANEVLEAIGYAPRFLQRPISKLAASPRAFNLVVSNIPGPREPLYMLGCELEAAYPVVPLSDGHGVSIGMTTIRDDVCLGVYADRESVPDADLLSEAIDDSIDELLQAAA
jgi:diacylglycerol O-acyltransferase / wax synthase